MTSSGPVRRWLVLLVVGLAQLMVVLDTTIVNIALPRAQVDLRFSADDRQWVVTAYALAFGGLLLVGARLSRLWGCRAVFIGGLVGFAAASALGGAAWNYHVLIIARTAQGLFGAMLAPSTLTILSETFADRPDRGRAFGIFGAIAGAGGALGMILGGVLTETQSWRWCLYVNVPFAALAVAGAFIYIARQERDRAARLDWAGSALVVAGLTALVYAFAQVSTTGWDGAPTVIGLTAGVLLLATFAAVERVVHQPLVPLRLFHDRTRVAAYAGITLIGAAVLGLFLIMTYYLQSLRELSPIETGLTFLPFTVGALISSNLASNLALPRFGPRIVVPTAMLVSASGALWLTRIDLSTSVVAGIAPALFLFGLGLGATVASSILLGLTGAGGSDASVASGLVTSCQQVGGSLGAAVLNSVAVAAAGVAATSGSVELQRRAALHGDTVAFAGVFVMLVVGAGLTVLLYRSRPHHPSVTAPSIAVPG